MSLFSIPKADVIAASPSVANMTAFNNLAANTYGFTLQGALNFGPSVGHGAILAIDNQFVSLLNRFNVNGATLIFGAPMLLTAGLGTVNIQTGVSVKRWGDFAAARLDPSDPNSFWVFNEFADTDR